MRTKYGNYKEYHTSDDNLNFISEKNLVNSLKCILEIIKEIQNNQIFVKNVYCEPFLTKYGMIHTTSSVKNTINNIKEKGITPNARLSLLRRIIASMGAMDAIEFINSKLKNTKSNSDLYNSMNKPS